MVPVAPCVKINLYLKLLFVHLNMVRLKGSCSLNSWRNYLPFISNMFTASSLSVSLKEEEESFRHEDSVSYFLSIQEKIGERNNDPFADHGVKILFWSHFISRGMQYLMSPGGSWKK